MPLHVTYVFIKSLVNSRHNIFFSFGLFEMLAYIFLHGLTTRMVTAFIKVSKENLVGDFSFDSTSECKKWVFCCTLRIVLH